MFQRALLLLPLLHSCNPYPNALPARRFDSAIIEKIPDNKWWYGLPDTVPAFQLQKRDLRQVERILQTVFLEKIVAEHYETFIPLNHYNRQYLGYRNAQGQRIVLIQCFQKRDHIQAAYWRRQFFYMDDGCYSVFRVKINLDTGKWFDFNINPCA